jgi:hypothetical protein
MTAGHTEGAKKGKFCSLRKDTCDCGNKYQDILNGTESWGKYIQKHRVEIAIERSPEAHHVLPVASVTANVTANKKIRKKVVENTKWCVNDMANMIALPLFEMTFTHYLVEYEDEGALTPPPPFAGLPMHNYGHAAFQSEVDKELKKVAKDAQKNKKDHEEASETLLAALNKQRDFFKPRLASRGKRGKGTHIEFLNAIEQGDAGAPKWYIPFSMAEKPEQRPFPAAPGKSGLAKKLKDLLKALKDWDSL